MSIKYLVHMLLNRKVRNVIIPFHCKINYWVLSCQMSWIVSIAVVCHANVVVCAGITPAKGRQRPHTWFTSEHIVHKGHGLSICNDRLHTPIWAVDWTLVKVSLEWFQLRSHLYAVVSCTVPRLQMGPVQKRAYHHHSLACMLWTANMLVLESMSLLLMDTVS